MIATDRFVFIHLHKSGGTFVNECLLRFIPGARRLGYHLPRTLIPSAISHLPVLGLVRAPWSYYVSWYAFQSTRPVFSGGAGTLHVGRMENMRADLLEMLAAVGQPVTEPMQQFILQHEPTNISSHRPYTECYSDSLRDLVAERDGEIIAAQRWRFGD